MRGALWLPIVGMGLFAGAGCSTSLDSFRCTESAECVEEGSEGVCHSSGYCAFVDEDGCDGLRFGEHSGENSGQCVGAATEPDAGTVPADANPNAPDADPAAPDAEPGAIPPTALINPISLACSATQITPDGRNSSTIEGETIVEYTWTLRAPAGGVLSTLKGFPPAEFTPNANFLSGEIHRPRVNLTPYMDEHALFVDTDQQDSIIFQSEVNIPSGAHRLSFAVASRQGQDTSQDFEYLVGIDETNITAQGAINLTEDMRTYVLDFSTAGGVPGATVAFFTRSGEFYLDNVRLYKLDSDASGDAPLLLNPSFETGAILPWEAELDNPTAEAERRDLPANLAHYGDYKIELVVKDSRGLSSDPHIVNVSHAACP